MRSLCFTALLAWATTAAADGERLAYVVGCINCHHQTPKQIMDAPPLLIVRAYSLDQFRTLLRTGMTLAGRDLLAIGSIMGVVAAEQFSHMTDGEIEAIYRFLRDEWSEERAAAEEAKIPELFKAKLEKGPPGSGK